MESAFSGLRPIPSNSGTPWVSAIRNSKSVSLLHASALTFHFSPLPPALHLPQTQGDKDWNVPHYSVNNLYSATDRFRQILRASLFAIS